MAYHREWDQGKPSYDDHYADSKRRKFNSGVLILGYEASQAYTDYDNGAGASFPKKRLQPSEPSPHVIFLGLDPDFNEADLQKYLVSLGCSIESVTIIRERTSGTCSFVFHRASKGFGFACFSSIEHARTFVDPRFPFVQIPPPASHGATATATFYKAIESGVPHNGRRVKIDFSQSVNPSDRGKGNRANANDGTRDIGSAPAAVLLFRGLDPLSGPQAIYQAMLSSSGPGKIGAKGMKRIILIKDKTTLASLGFAFVEFVDIQAASTVLGATMSPQIHPSGFRISDRPVAVSFAHPYSFQPIADLMIRDDACIAGSTSLGGEDNTLVRYWDETSTIAHLEFEVEESTQPTAATATTKDKKEKKKHRDTEVVQDMPAAASALPVSDKPVTLSFNKGLGRAGPVPAKPVNPAFSLDDGGIDNEVEEERAKGSARVVPLMASKKTATNINKWNQVQEELKDSAPQTTSSLVTFFWLYLPKIWAPVKKSEPVASMVVDTQPPEDDFEFSDLDALTCLLCARQLASMLLCFLIGETGLTQLSGMLCYPQKNLKDANLRDVARQKVATRKAASGSEQPKYRDRASERRVLFNQPEVPVPEKDNNKTGTRKRQADGPPPPPSPPPAPVNPGQDDSNVGNKLLKMMGWTEGTGLGTSGEGRVDPISAAVYAQGVGLGAMKGKDITTITSKSTFNAMPHQKANQKFRFGSWIRLHGVDLITMALMGALGLGIYEAPPAPSRSFPVYFQDGQVVYPQFAYPMRKEIVPIVAAALIAFFVPFFFFCLFQLRRRSLEDLCTTTLGLLKSLITAAVFQVWVKWLIGGLRPHFLVACMPNIQPGAAPSGNGFASIMYDRSICTGDEKTINDSLESMPSGHSTAAWAGLFYLSLYFNAQLKVMSAHNSAYWKMILMFCPLLGATLISGALTIDEFHNWYDVLAGAIIGISTAIVAFRSTFAAVTDFRYNHIALPRATSLFHRHGAGDIMPFFDYSRQAEYSSHQLPFTREGGWGLGGAEGVVGAPGDATALGLGGGAATNGARVQNGDNMV
ncbi:RhoA GTPase effector DIA/Diaphanous [Mycena indigotica]|uniref:RhoA GTPase effector DIA/Diaphanous n=1 Tax=Mycena indigotica TaxID=2126181 RepID=A0A8H6VYT5_9AGAR|nr:RhoA GTPase effector DIA/Diaphanous [Mycena indigotica]KAF7295248.1 RhoA GTPase effector DIA/Diaphanous [Mycena indigotica]